jgi:hypothetical protein
MRAVLHEMPDGLVPAEQNERMRRALHEGLDDEARERIVREETLAWAIGRETLVQLGLHDLTRYDQRTRIGLHNHRYRLGLEDAWPIDFAGPSAVE